jgi:serine protease AprX
MAKKAKKTPRKSPRKPGKAPARSAKGSPKAARKGESARTVKSRRTRPGKPPATVGTPAATAGLMTAPASTIPNYVVEYFLLGQTRRGAVERYTQDGGIVIDVWLEFAKDILLPRRMLVAPSGGARTVDLGYVLQRTISAYRKAVSKEPVGDIAHSFPKDRERLNISPLENFVALTLYFDELLRIVLPLTRWWEEKNLRALHRKAINVRSDLGSKLRQAITIRLGREDENSLVKIRQELSASDAQPDAMLQPSSDDYPSRRVIEAAPIAALIGVFCATIKDPNFIANTTTGLANQAANTFLNWVLAKAEAIADAATQELKRNIQAELLQTAFEVAGPTHQPTSDTLPALIERVFLNRRAQLADTEAICTIKADAATRLFEISCRDVVWAIIDTGIDPKHPAFLDHGAKNRRGEPLQIKPSRIKSTVDFTLIHEIRNFDLTEHPHGSAERSNDIRAVVQKLRTLPGRTASAAFDQMATAKLKSIAEQLDMRIQPDWAMIEPLIRIENADGSGLLSSHGTHVAGILAADWRQPRRAQGAARAGAPVQVELEDIVLQGACPDIQIHDLRVVTVDRESTEFGLLAAIEYVQQINQRSAAGPVIHGVNISLSIPHDVRNYGCGATPICVACDRLAMSGVVVVAAAGNRGWNEQEIGFGNFVFCSITDPGNAHHVITVGSTHRSNPHAFGVSYFSSRGPTGDGRIKPDLVAPGEKIRGPIRGDADDRLDGTSMAAPYVSAAAAILMARNRELIGNSLKVKDILCRSATDLGREKYFQGHGLVDVLRALQSL